VLVVDLPEELQVQRVGTRSGLPPGEVRAIMASQSSRADRLAAADDVIDNRGDLAALRTQVAALHAKYVALAKNAHG
jgi:dephospho-CoA kinase